MFVYKIKMFVVIPIATAYDELEVSNSQTAVDMCQCVYEKSFHIVANALA